MVSIEKGLEMTASSEAKKAGFNNLQEVENMLGKKDDGNPLVSRQTLDGWYKNKRILFDTVLANAPRNQWISPHEYKPSLYDLAVIKTNEKGIHIGYILFIESTNPNIPFVFVEIATNHQFSIKSIDKMFILPGA